jgi:transcriptional regulator with XRE-family HTH domain
MRKTLRSSEYQAFLDLLRAARKSAGLTQQALARKLRRPQSFVAKYENGERRIDVVEFAVLARAFDVDPVVLFREFVETNVRTKSADSDLVARRRRAGRKAKLAR